MTAPRRGRLAKAEAHENRVTAIASEFFATVTDDPADALLWPQLRETFKGFVRVALVLIEARRRAARLAGVKYSADGGKSV